jgi:hypothetical protein
MKIIREFSRFVASYKPINLYIKGQSPIIIDEDKAREKELLIKSIIKSLYPEMKSSDSYITTMGVDLRTDLLNKAQKNISILYEIVDIARENGIKLETSDSLIDFILKNSKDLFKVGGRFFDRIYARLENVSKKGKDKESISDELFQRYAKSKGKYVNLQPPGSSDEDIKGVDSYFILNDNKYTIQTKTLSDLSKYKSGEYYRVYISGYYTDIKTNYLVLIPEESSSNKKYIFKGRNVKTLKDMRGLDYYSIPSSDLLYSED